MTDDARIAESPVHTGSRPAPAFVFYISAIASALFMVRLLGAGWSTHFPAVWPDAIFPNQGYLAVAGKGPFRPSFYFAYRPIGYPLLLWALRRNSLATVVVQSALYCAVVIALCTAALRVLHSQVVAGATVLAIVGISLQAKYAMWNTQILSESLAISLGFASIAAWWRFAAAPTRGRARWAWAFLVAWLLVRDAHVLPATIVIVPVALGVAALGRSLDAGVRRTLTVGAVIVMLTAGYSYASESASHRAELSFHDVVGIRVLPDSELTSWFAAHGMPLDPALRTRTGKGGLVDDFYLTKDPAFAKYRHWARGPGPRALALSLVVLAPHYASLIDKDLPGILRGDVHAYDTQGVYDRLPRQMLGLGGPTGRVGLVIWLSLAGAALATSLVLALRRKCGIGLVVFGAAVLVLTLVEGYATWGGDPVELERHMIGVFSRLSVVLVIVTASGLDTAIAAARARGRPGRRKKRPPVRRAGALPVAGVIRWLTAFALTLVGVVALIGNRVQAAGNDAVFTQSLVNRAARFGGTYYDNGITPKGPLEDVAHDIALRVGGYDGHFYVISIMVAVSAALLGFAAARTARKTGANRPVELAVGAAVFVHFTLSSTAYAGLLYSRNILVTLFAVAWLLTLTDGAWANSRRLQFATAAATGALLGLGVQTILPSFIDAAAIGIGACLLLTRRIDDKGRRRALRRTTAVAAVAGFASAPVWYLLRGGFASFWASWYTYANDQYRGIGLSLGQELSRGGNNFRAYYQHRPLLFVMIAAFVAITIAEWPRFDRTTRVLHVSLLGWFAGGWFQLVTGERYSTHYFSVIAAPSAMIGAALAGHAYAAVSTRPRVSRTTIAWPLLAIMASFALSGGTASRLAAAASITSSFTSVQRAAQLERANQPGPNRSVQAVLDLVSRDRDPLLAYSDDQFLYPRYRRIPATRFQQRYFLIGAIYLGQTGPQYILPDTWRWFRDDLRQANPAAFLETERIDSKPFARYVATHFRTAFDGEAGTVKLRNDVADAVIRGGSAPDVWTPPRRPVPASGWTAGPGSATYARSSIPMPEDRLTLATHGCERVEGDLNGTPVSSPSVVFHFEDPSGRQPEMKIEVDGSYVSVEDDHDILLDTIPTGRTASTAAPLRFALVVGRRAAALVIGDRIVGAVDIPPDVRVRVEPLQSRLGLTDLRVGRPPRGSGC